MSVLGRRSLEAPVDSPRKRSNVKDALSALQSPSPRVIPRVEDEPDPDHLSQPRIEEKD